MKRPASAFEAETADETERTMKTPASACEDEAADDKVAASSTGGGSATTTTKSEKGRPEQDDNYMVLRGKGGVPVRPRWIEQLLQEGYIWRGGPDAWPGLKGGGKDHWERWEWLAQMEAEGWLWRVGSQHWCGDPEAEEEAWEREDIEMGRNTVEKKEAFLAAMEKVLKAQNEASQTQELPDMPSMGQRRPAGETSSLLEPHVEKSEKMENEAMETLVKDAQEETKHPT